MVLSGKILVHLCQFDSCNDNYSSACSDSARWFLQEHWTLCSLTGNLLPMHPVMSSEHVGSDVYIAPVEFSQEQVEARAQHEDTGRQANFRSRLETSAYYIKHMHYSHDALEQAPSSRTSRRRSCDQGGLWSRSANVCSQHASRAVDYVPEK